jgi:hypothetical protein
MLIAKLGQVHFRLGIHRGPILKFFAGLAPRRTSLYLLTRAPNGAKGKSTAEPAAGGLLIMADLLA